MELEVISRLPQPTNNKSNIPLLFVHGAWHAAWCWDEYFLPYFAQAGYPAYALSLRGHGKSEGDLHGAGLQEYIQDVRQVSQQLDQAPVIIGHSMSGYVVLKYLEQYTAPGAVLMGAMSPTMPPRFLKTLAYPATWLGAKLLRNKLLPAPPARWAKPMLFSPSLDDNVALDYGRRLENDSLAFIFDFMRPSPVLTRQIKRTPLLIQTAMNDSRRKYLLNENDAVRFEADYQLFKNTAHDMMLENSWQEVADGILSWLAKLCGSEQKIPVSDLANNPDYLPEIRSAHFQD
jgi:pimeloyl-ACP methyl ester carboxylesterase